MINIEDIHPGDRIDGIVGETVEIVQTEWAYDLLRVTYRLGNGQVAESVLGEEDGEILSRADAPGDATSVDTHAWKVAVEALRLKHAALIDPMLAVSSSSLQPLPHQIKAVYGEFLPRTPLRYLLADDPGAGKTIMCGLYIKEMLLRDDLSRCLIVVPGSLSEQWAQELWDKFGLDFTVLTRELIATTASTSVFSSHPLLIARMDMLSRDQGLIDQLEQTDWDLVVVDEAHRMSAEGTTPDSKKTKRYDLGRVLATTTRNFLLMTATPHSGDPERFQAFLALLDEDRFGSHRISETARPGTDLMRRMLKEELLTMEGKPLFPERRAQTVPYPLGARERELYDEVTTYVRDEMNRAESLRRGQQRTVGFAMMVLQRRLASSPESILQSLRRRHTRLLAARPDFVAGRVSGASPEFEILPEDDETESLAALEKQEHDGVLDSVTAAQSLAELDHEIRSVARLVEIAEHVRASGEDAKWSALRTLLDDPSALREDGSRRKLIIFTEFRDTLDYLEQRISTLPGWTDKVVQIHGGMPRTARLAVQRAFTTDPRTSVLLATDAAGEGLNLQSANLMVNYDLPWNPNRLEQRFGRIHRIGQTEVCHLWNLVATDTLEGDVYERLLTKMEEQAASLSGKVFDVLGDAFATNTPLSTLLTEAIRHGEDPAVKARLDTVIDDTVNDDVPELVRERARYAEVLQNVDLAAARQRAEDGAAAALQPHYSGPWLRAALPALGGSVRPRPGVLFDVTVPQTVKDQAQSNGAPPLLSQYRGVSLGHPAEAQEGTEVLGPGHPLFQAVATATVNHSRELREVAVLVDPHNTSDDVRVFVAGSHEITDGTPEATVLSRTVAFVEIDASGAHQVGPSYLDLRALAPEERAAANQVLDEFGGPGRARELAEEWANRTLLIDHRRTVSASHRAAMERRRAEVTDSLTQAARYWDQAAAGGGRRNVSVESARQKAQDARDRLARRTAAFAAEERIVPRPPQVHATAVVIPLCRLQGRSVPEHRARQADAVAVLASRGLQADQGTGGLVRVTRTDGREHWLPVPQPTSNEVRLRRTDVAAGLNLGDTFRVLLIAQDGTMRTVAAPFRRASLDDFDTHEFEFSWDAWWRRGEELA